MPTTSGTLPARVLEFGCGIGRHLRYLKTIPGLEVHGYDQSPQMVAGMQAWAEPDWLESHVRTGAAVGRLPYADGAFDVVFTAEVLVHVRPEHLASILAELVRVARWQVVHFETAADFPLDAGDTTGAGITTSLGPIAEKASPVKPCRQAIARIGPTG